jgi:hypothetical protein
MMKRLVILTWLLATFISSDLFSQSREENRNNFYDAESWILFEAYQDALPIYQQLLKTFPDNSNYKYRIGQCYINIPGEKIKAVSYLEDAVKHINPEYKEGKFSETGAPYDALYYLANAYRINNQLDKAIETYQAFRKNMNPEVYDSTIVALQIESCRNAKELMRMPSYVKMKNLGNVINGSNNEFNPVVSDKEDLLVFSRSQAFYDAILFSTKKNGVWSAPVNMNEMLKVDRDLFPTSLSNDGRDLYLYSSADYDGIIYSSRYENGTWSPLVKLNDNINTKYWESHATISHDNKKLYFTSNRKGTLGNLDIYVSNRDSTGNWGPAINLGPVINTPYNEESPFLSEDDKTLFFSSRGHLNMGGYDVFYSTLLDNGQWSTPINVGYPLNTTDDDVFFMPLNKGYEGYTAKEVKGGYGKQDIYRIEVFSDNNPRKFYVKGTVKVADLISSLSDSIKVSVINLKYPKKPVVVHSDPKTGQYAFHLSQGDYQFSYEGNGGERVNKKVVLPLLNPSDSIDLNSTILPKTDFTAFLIIGTSKTISVRNGDSISIPVKVEPRSFLTIEHWTGGKMVSTRKYSMPDSSMTYKLSPATGDNKVVFKLIDRFNNNANAEVLITRKDASRLAVKPADETASPEKQSAAYSDMMKVAAVDPAIAIISNKVATYGSYSEKSEMVTKAANDAGNANLQTGGLWLEAFSVNALAQGMTQKQLSEMISVISSMPDTKAEQYLNDLIAKSEEPLTSALKSIDLKKSGIETPEDLINYLLTKKDLYPNVYSSLANLVASGNIPDDIIKSHFAGNKCGYMWILWVAIGLGLFFLFFIFWKRKRKDKKE